MWNSTFIVMFSLVSNHLWIKICVFVRMCPLYLWRSRTFSTVCYFSTVAQIDKPNTDFSSGPFHIFSSHHCGEMRSIQSVATCNISSKCHTGPLECHSLQLQYMIEHASFWHIDLLLLTKVLSHPVQVLYRRQLDFFQFLEDISTLNQGASSVRTNWRGVAGFFSLN